MAVRRIAALLICFAIAGCATTQEADEDGGDLQASDTVSPEAGVDPDLANEELADGSPKPGTATPATATESLIEITDLRYRASEAGGTVVLETSAPATFRTRELPNTNQVVVEIANARVPDRFKLPYNSKDFRQEIASFNAYQDSSSSTARIVIQFRSAASAAVRQEGRQLFVSYAPPGAGGNWVDRETDAAGPGAYSVEGQRRIGGGSSFEDPNGIFTKFYGKPISLEARDTPVREVINAIAEQSGVNIILSEEVKSSAKVTLKLRQVPWDQALMLIMKTQRLGYVRQGTVLRISTLDSLRIEADEAKKLLDAQRRAQPLRTKIVPISYAKVEDMVASLKTFQTALNAAAAPAAGAAGGAPAATTGSVAGDVRTSSIVITDIPDNIDRMINVLKALDAPPLQVMIEAKVLEASESFRRNFGINFGADGAALSSGSLTISPSGPSFSNLATPLRNTFNLSIGTFDGLGNLNALIGLQEEQDTVKILSAPRITTMNNVRAVIEQTVNVPVPTLAPTQTGQAATNAPLVGVNRIPIGLKLEVTPQITAESDVIMKVMLSREFVASGAPSALANSERRMAETTVLVKNGQTSVIGGVYQNDSIMSESGVPLLKDIPVLGYLFKGTDKTKIKNELLLFLTPRILNAEKHFSKEDTL